MFLRCFLLCSLLTGLVCAAATQPVPLTFTDQAAVLPCPDGTWPWTMRTITRDGWGPTAEGEATAAEEMISVKPLAEGIHILTVKTPKPTELRFLAIAPPPPADGAALRKALPRSAEKLLGGRPVVILAMGDSVTATGDFPRMLALLLQRATGNGEITVVNRSYPGRSADAAVRFFARDTANPKPDVGLLMYGLNDQGAGTSLAGYLEQYRWIAERLVKDCGADPVFLTPTPDISRESVDKPFTPYVFRTIAFVSSVETLGRELDIPTADTFQAIWGEGKDDLQSTARSMWPLFGLHYSKQATSMIESDGKGDGIHPNALGHLEMARAVFAALAGAPAPRRLAASAESRWTAGGLSVTLTLHNPADAPRSGTLTVYPLPGYGVPPAEGLAYTLPARGKTTLTVPLPEWKTPDALRAYPANVFLEAGDLIMGLMDQSGGGCRVQAVAAPFAGPRHRFVRERTVVTGRQAVVRIEVGDRVEQQTVELPDRPAGRIALTHQAEGDTAVAELAFVRYAAARRGEAEIDGDLAEWKDDDWVDISDPIHARWTRGPDDLRETPDECRVRWAVRAGKEGLDVAVEARGAVAEDMFTLFFDTRPAAQLGTVGPYYWVSGGWKKGVLNVGGGETSPRGLHIVSSSRTQDGRSTIEFRVPWAAMDARQWPADGDLGLSFWWRHKGPKGVTNLQWSEDGHPWSTRWYGVVRLQTDHEPLPFMVRVK